MLIFTLMPLIAVSLPLPLRFHAVMPYAISLFRWLSLFRHFTPYFRHYYATPYAILRLC
jgi:hypothetical protein